MTAREDREELREMIDRVVDEDLDVAAMRLMPLVENEPRRQRPRFIGMGRSGHSDTSERVDEILRETGFGE